MPLMPKQAKGFFDLQKVKIDRCLHPSFQCQEKAIRAHSIQNSKVLDLLQSDGHVVMMYPKLSKDEQPRGEFRKIGRNDATTFTGLCSKHDTEMFKEVDSEAFDPNSEVHRRQLVLRSVMKEFHTLLEAGTRIQTAYLNQVNAGLIRADVPTGPGIEAMRAMLRAHKVFIYMGRALESSEKPDLFEHHVIQLNQEPAVAVSSVFSVYQHANGDYAFCTLNILPVSDKQTFVIVSFLAADREKVREALASVFGAKTEDETRKELSKLIIQRVENFVLSPKKFDSWPDEKKKLISEQFNLSMTKAEKVPDHDHMMLF